MVFSPQAVENFPPRSTSAATTGLLLPLPTGRLGNPVSISLDEWGYLPIDERAPVRSVALVRVLGDDFIVLVVDTVAEKLRWQIAVSRANLVRVYDGMLSETGGQPRGTSIVSIPPDVDVSATPSNPGGNGPGGDPVALPQAGVSLVIANLFAKILAASVVRITEASEGPYSALLFQV
jgi:hypothetical protein